jgi:hypothetical protein
MFQKARAQAVVKVGRGLSFSFMKPKLLSWNVRGLNEWNKYLRVRNLLREWKVVTIHFLFFFKYKTFHKY